MLILDTKHESHRAREYTCNRSCDTVYRVSTMQAPICKALRKTIMTLELYTCGHSDILQIQSITGLASLGKRSRIWEKPNKPVTWSIFKNFVRQHAVDELQDLGLS